MRPKENYLIPGNVVVTKRGVEYEVGEYEFFNGPEAIAIDQYDDDLRHVSNPRLQIVSIFTPGREELIWSNAADVILTRTERSMLKQLSKEYKYITRDYARWGNGAIKLWKSEPVLDNGSFWKSMHYDVPSQSAALDSFFWDLKHTSPLVTISELLKFNSPSRELDRLGWTVCIADNGDVWFTKGEGVIEYRVLTGKIDIFNAVDLVLAPEDYQAILDYIREGEIL